MFEFIVGMHIILVNSCETMLLNIIFSMIIAIWFFFPHLWIKLDKAAAPSVRIPRAENMFIPFCLPPKHPIR